MLTTTYLVINSSVNWIIKTKAMTPLPKKTLELMLKVKVLLQLLNKSKLRDGTKSFLEPKFFSIYSQI